MTQPDAEWRARVDAFLCAFLRKSPEELEAALAAPSAPAVSIARWANRLRSGPHPIVLPCARGGGAPPEYYGIAFNGRQVRDLREQLTAFVGPTWTDFTGGAILPNPADPAEKAILALTDQPIFRLRLASRDMRAPVRGALDRMLEVAEAAAERDPEDVRATGRVLRQFYHALNAGDRRAAEAELAFLQSRQRLDALNLQFLEVQVRACSGAWDEILALPAYRDLAQGRRPVAVSRALLQALYYVYLAPHEAAGDLPAMATAFGEEVLPRAGTLLTTRAGMTQPEILKQFMLLAVVGTPPQPELRDELLALVAQMADGQGSPLLDADREIIRRLSLRDTGGPPPVRVAPQPGDDLLDAARQALSTGHYDRALSLAQQAALSVDQTRVLLVSALEIDTLEAREAARAAFEALELPAREQVLTSRMASAAWSQLFGAPDDLTASAQAPAIAAPLVPPVQPQHWGEWLAALEAEELSPGTLERWAAQGADEWDPGALSMQPEMADRLADALYDLAGDDRLQNALPHLVRYLQRDLEYPRKVLLGLYHRVRFALVAGTLGTDVDVAAFGDLCQAAFELGLSREDYSELLLETRDLWNRSSGSRNVEPWLDVLDQLIYYPCPPESRDERRSLLNTVLSTAAAWARAGRVNSADWETLSQLAAEVEMDELLAGVEFPGERAAGPAAAPEPLRQFRGTIALYTLTESAGQRARQVLQRWNSHCRTELSTEKVGSPQLRDLARNADVFVMVTGSAKHAATSYIQAHRGNRPLLRPSGKGTSSILRELVKYLGGLAGEGAP